MGYLPIEGTKMLVLLPDGIYLEILRRCYEKNETVLHSQLRIQQCYVKDIQCGIQRNLGRTLKLLRSGTTITKINERQRNEKWLKYGTIQFDQRQNFEINKHNIK